MAHNGKTGELNIESELFDARQVRILNIAEKYNKKLKRSELKTYGDVNISAKDIKLENFILLYGSTQNEKRSTLFDISISAENDIYIGSGVHINHFNSSGMGMGGDVIFSANNIYNRVKPSDVNAVSYPTINTAGTYSFIAKKDLEIGRMLLQPVNSNRSSGFVNYLRGENITLGMDLGDETVGAEHVIFNYHNNSIWGDRLVIEAENDVNFISGVNLTTAALTINSDNLDINNSHITRIFVQFKYKCKRCN